METAQDCANSRVLPGVPDAHHALETVAVSVAKTVQTDAVEDVGAVRADAAPDAAIPVETDARHL